MIRLLKRRFVLETFKIIVALSIISWLLMSGKIDLMAIRYVLNFKSIVLCWTAVFITFVTVSIRWKILLESQNVKISLSDSLRMSLIGSFFSFVLPGGVSGDAVKAYYVSKDRKDKSWTSGVSVIVDRYMGFSSLCLMAFVATLSDFSRFKESSALASIQTFLAIVLTIVILFGYIVFTKQRYTQAARLFRRLDIKFGEKSQAFFSALSAYGVSSITLLKAIAISLVGHLITILVFSYMGSEMGEHLPLEVYFYCVPIAIMLSAIPLAPGGIGVGQAAYYFIFNLYLGRVSDLGPTLVTIYQLIIFSFSLVGAVFYLQLKRSTDFNETNSAQNQPVTPS